MKRTVLALVSLTAMAVPLFAADAAPQSAFGGFVPLIVIFVIFYFLLIRPQQKRAKEHTALLNALKKDDKIITNGGLYGVITAVRGDVIEVKIAEGVKVEVSRQGVATVVTKEAAAKAEEIVNKPPQLIK
jgi:preprotein translocase subunit YajC